ETSRHPGHTLPWGRVSQPSGTPLPRYVSCKYRGAFCATPAREPCEQGQRCLMSSYLYLPQSQPLPRTLPEEDAVAQGYSATARPSPLYKGFRQYLPTREILRDARLRVKPRGKFHAPEELPHVL